MKPIKEPTESQRAESVRKAEIAVFDALLADDLEGKVYYDVRVGKQIGMFAWMTGLWRCAIEVKGSQHMVKNGN